MFSQSNPITAGMVIHSSVIIERKTYQLNAQADLSLPLITIEGNNIVVDLNQAIIQGSNDQTAPDAFYGLCILIKKGSSHITLKNGNVHGFKIAIRAEEVTNLTIENCDLSYNWRQHVCSNYTGEDEKDWLSFHQNEKDEWLRYGAGIYLKNCKKAVIRNNTITGGQCGLLMTLCDEANVSDNRFSFNSGLGIGMYRCNRNIIENNRLDYNVRGFYFGRYYRGQDSAGILVFEQSSDNIFAFNSATHCGDGFFLWAGQSTMDNGKGGSNDNFIYGNDFSFAPTNGIEVTFSRNLIMKNRLEGCDHGIWGGYSFDADITDNEFENNRIGIAIEHGQNINIALNHFTNDTIAIKIWSRTKQPADWAYPKLKNTDSKNYWIAANQFIGNKIAYDVMGTDTIVFSGNTKKEVMTNWQFGDRLENLDTSRENEQLDMEYQKDKRLSNIKTTSLPLNTIPRGKSFIRITDWGPYNYHYPILWLESIDNNGWYHFSVLGEQGSWQLKALAGFLPVEINSGNFPATLVAKPLPDAKVKWIQMAYQGPSFIDAFGKIQDSSSQHLFSYKENNH